MTQDPTGRVEQRQGSREVARSRVRPHALGEGHRGADVVVVVLFPDASGALEQIALL
jgi:hypothetical protein